MHACEIRHTSQALHLNAISRMRAQVALKCADVGHLALPEQQHRMWVERLQEELYLQGDQERALGIPISALMDRTKPSTVANSQVGAGPPPTMPFATPKLAHTPHSCPGFDDTETKTQTCIKHVLSY